MGRYQQFRISVEAIQSAIESDECSGHFGASRKGVSSSLFILLAGSLWLGIVLTGSFLLLQYSQAPGASGALPSHWPETSWLPYDHDRPTLVMFIHPHCPCSRASIGELEILMAKCQGKVGAQVWFIQPKGMDEAWVKTDLWRSAEVIPGVKVHRDEGGMEARRFHAETSGQTALYNSSGALMFQGGLTLSRGHSGDNPGRDAITAMLANELSIAVQTPVFGCALWETECKLGEGTCKP